MLRLWDVPVFKILVAQGSHMRKLNETEARSLITMAESRPMLECQGCHANVHPENLFNLNREHTNGTLYLFCIACVARGAGQHQIPTGIKRWLPLLYSLEHALQKFTENRLEPVLVHNRQVEHELRQREAHERRLARAAQATAGTLLGIRPKADGTLTRSARRAAKERQNGWKGLTRQTA